MAKMHPNIPFPLLFIGLIDIEDQKQMYLLHYIFLPRINRVISSFVACWNRHPIRTESNWSPERIWTNGMIDLRNRYQIPVAEAHEQIGADDLEWYGIDHGAPCSMDDSPEQVQVDDIESTFSLEEMHILHQINPLDESFNYGLSIYIEAYQLLFRG